MKLKAKKDFNWSINYKKKLFKNEQNFEVNEELGEKMIASGYASACRKEKKVEDTKAVESTNESPYPGPAENKAIESTNENKEAPKKEKSKKKK